MILNLSVHPEGGSDLPWWHRLCSRAYGIGSRFAMNRRNCGFSLVEVVVSVAISGVAFGSILFGYVKLTDRAEWSSYSLAAQSLAMQGVEQARGAKWDPAAWPAVDELGLTNYTQVETLDIPVAGTPMYATNYISVTTAWTKPPIRQMRADCVWTLASRGAAIRGPFTNTVITLRAADQ